MLSERQQLTIKHLNSNLKKKQSPKEIILWAQNNISRSRADSKRKYISRAGRKHSKLYYQQIIEHYLPLVK